MKCFAFILTCLLTFCMAIRAQENVKAPNLPDEPHVDDAAHFNVTPEQIDCYFTAEKDPSGELIFHVFYKGPGEFPRRFCGKEKSTWQWTDAEGKVIFPAPVCDPRLSRRDSDGKGLQFSLKPGACTGGDFFLKGTLPVRVGQLKTLPEMSVSLADKAVSVLQVNGKSIKIEARYADNICWAYTKSPDKNASSDLPLAQVITTPGTLVKVSWDSPELDIKKIMFSDASRPLEWKTHSRNDVNESLGGAVNWSYLFPGRLNTADIKIEVFEAVKEIMIPVSFSGKIFVKPAAATPMKAPNLPDDSSVDDAAHFNVTPESIQCVYFSDYKSSKIDLRLNYAGDGRLIPYYPADDSSEWTLTDANGAPFFVRDRIKHHEKSMWSFFAPAEKKTVLVPSLINGTTCYDKDGKGLQFSLNLKTFSGGDFFLKGTLPVRVGHPKPLPKIPLTLTPGSDSVIQVNGKPLKIHVFSADEKKNLVKNTGATVVEFSYNDHDVGNSGATVVEFLSNYHDLNIDNITLFQGGTPLRVSRFELRRICDTEKRHYYFHAPSDTVDIQIRAFENVKDLRVPVSVEGGVLVTPHRN